MKLTDSLYLQYLSANDYNSKIICPWKKCK